MRDHRTSHSSLPEPACPRRLLLDTPPWLGATTWRSISRPTSNLAEGICHELFHLLNIGTSGPSDRRLHQLRRRALQAVILTKVISLIVVITALPARLLSVLFSDVGAHWYIIVNLLAGSLVGAWLGATWATRMASATLYKVLAVLLLLIAATLALTHLTDVGTLALDPLLRTIIGVVAGVGIGVVAALMGVAGGELLIPTITLLYAVDIKLAGSLSLAVSLPTMIVAFARCSRYNSFQALRDNQGFVVTMAAGSIAGTILGGLLLGVVPTVVLIPLLLALLLLSSIKVWNHQ